MLERSLPLLPPGELSQLYQFLCWSSGLRGVLRQNHATQGRRENSAEHSWHLALMAWTLHRRFETEFEQEINIDRVIKMCLMHDLVEIDVGDVPVWSRTADDGLEERENQAAEARFSGLPDGLAEELLSLWREFNQLLTLEAKIARGIDRCNASLMKLLTGQGWNDMGVTVRMLDAKVRPDLSFSSTLTQLYDQIQADALARGLLQP